MKRRTQEKGELDWAAEDLIELQSQPFEAIDTIFKQFGNVVISGCEVAGNSIGDGVVMIDGMIMPFLAANNVSYPCYLIVSKNAVNHRYVDGLEKPISYDYKAIVTTILPQNRGFIVVNSKGVERLLRKASDAVDSDSSNTFATSKAVCVVNAKIKPLALASSTIIGGIKAKGKTTEMAEVAIDPVSGKLFAPTIAGEKGDTGAFDTSTILAALTTSDKTVPGAINELNSGKAKTDLTNVSLVKALSANGYYKAPDGFMIQWGLVSSSSLNNIVYFPITFSFVFSLVTNVKSITSSEAVVIESIKSLGTSSFTVSGQYVGRDGGGGQATEPFYWIAVGRWK